MKLLFKVLIIVLYSALNIVLTIVFNYSWLICIDCILTAIYVFLLAERSILGHSIALIAHILYAIISWQHKIYGEVIFYLAINTPIAIASFFTWKKNIDRLLTVQTKTLKKTLYAPIVIILIISIFFYEILLDKLGGVYSFADALLSAISLIALILMMMRYKEQWIVWLFSNLICLIIWCMVGDFLIILNCIFCFINSLYGLKNWALSSENNINQV